MVKNLNQTTDWRVFDLARGDNFILEPNNTDAEINSVQLEMSEGGFNLLTGSDTVNSVNNEFIFLAFADNTLTDGFTEYDYPTTDDVLTINSGTQLGFANGYDSSGGENNSLEVVPSSTTLTLGSGFENQKLYIYKDKGGNYGTTPYRPLEGTSPEQADKWGEASPLGGGTRTTAKHFNYESSTGVASASGEDSSTAWQAFDKDVELKWIVLSTSTSWLQYKYFEPRVLKSWRLREDPANTSTPRRFTIEGSNNGVSWGVVDDTYASADYPLAGPSKWGDIQEGFPQSGAYQYYRINITAQHGHPSSTAIAELELNTVTPSDFYSVSEGVMYPHADLVIQSPKALDYGWNATLTEDGFTTSQNGGAGSRTTGTYLEIGKQYKVTIDLTSTAGDLFLLQYDDDNVNISDAVALSQGYNEFTITANKVGFYLRSVHTATRTVNIGTFTVEEVVQPIERVYLGECLTGANGEVLSYESYTPAKTRGVDAEYQGDVTVHGEIKNKGVASAWVTFDGTQNPPLVSDSYNVDAVVDLGTGVYRVYSDRLTESCGISLLSSERTTEINDSSLPVSGYIDFTTRDGNGTNRDSSLVTLVIHGGTE